MLLTWEELQAVDFGDTEWWVEDLIPAGGTVLVWGKESIGKTPICWYLARDIALGESFFGYKTKTGRVLFIELDMPPRYTQKRLRHLPFPAGVRFELDDRPVVDLSDEGMAARFADAAAWKPDVVFVDSLRKAHPLDDKASETPSVVYNAYRRLFEGATLVFIHHERKTAKDDDRPGNESYSGSRAWSNDCEVGLWLEELKQAKFPLKLEIARNKIGEKGVAGRFHLADGYLLTIEASPDLLANLLREYEGAELVEQVRKHFHCSRATAFRRIAEEKAKS